MFLKLMMKMKLQLLIVIVLSLDKFPEKCQSTSENGKVFSITASTPAHVDILKNISTQFKTVLWQPASPIHITKGSEVHLYVPRESVHSVTQVLKSNQLTHRFMVENTEQLIEQQIGNNSTDPRQQSQFNERYYSLEDIYFWINKTTVEYGHMVKVILIGSSFEKRPLYVLKISGKASTTPKRAMWIDCGIHAREWISTAFCMWFVKYSVDHYKENHDITTMIDSMDIYVLPVMNPDGYKYTWTTVSGNMEKNLTEISHCQLIFISIKTPNERTVSKNRMWRKNRSIHPNSDCVGVDLNRNFDANWCTSGASHNPCDEIYCGQYPESEPESSAVANFLRTHKDTVKLYFSIHSYSQMLLFPYSCSHELARNHDELNKLASQAAKAIQRYYGNQYKYGPGSKTIYLAPGGSDDWAYGLGIDYSFTFELQDRGHYGFLLPPSKIVEACNDALLALKIITLTVIQ